MKQRWTVEELEEQWTLGPEEQRLVANKAGATRLAFMVLLKYFQHGGRFPQDEAEVPDAVVAHVAKQAGVPPEALRKYDWRGRTIEYHRAQIRAFLGFRQATTADAQDISRWLRAEVLPHDHDVEHLRVAVYERCRSERIEPPTPGRVDRLVRSALHTHEERLASGILRRISPEALAGIDALIAPSTEVPTGVEDFDGDEAGLRELRSGPGGVSLESLVAEFAKLRRIRSLGLPADLFEGVAPKRSRPIASGPRPSRQASCGGTYRRRGRCWSGRCASCGDGRLPTTSWTS